MLPSVLQGGGRFGSDGGRVSNSVISGLGGAQKKTPQILSRRWVRGGRGMGGANMAEDP